MITARNVLDVGKPISPVMLIVCRFMVTPAILAVIAVLCRRRRPGEVDRSRADYEGIIGIAASQCFTPDNSN